MADPSDSSPDGRPPDDDTLPPTRALPAEDAPREAGLPERIGRYRVLSKLGEGGMGVVYEAEQESPRRRVAVKVVRGGRFVDDARLRMFQREAETLARLDHPHIGAIYESGRTEDGQHFFAMELVRGRTLDAYLRDRGPCATRIEARFRVALCRRIARAVQYAHQRGVIHRDLKPGNILVHDDPDATSSTDDGAETTFGASIPSLKILDFGLARITEGDVAAATMTTEVGVIKGTLPYMSPEQARGDPHAIDVRADVYAIGVMLYEMLAGGRPYDLSKTSLVDAVRVICEQPARPLRQAASGAGAIDRDLETIAGKALEKDGDRRYASAAALAEDLARYLTSRPILARPPSTVYQLRKFAARNRVAFGAAVAVVVALVAGIVTTTWQAVAATRARARAELEASRAREVAKFNREILEGVGPQVALGRDTTLIEEILARSVDVVESDDLSGRPLVEAEIRRVIGTVYKDLGRFEVARPHLERAVRLGRENDEESREDLADALVLLGILDHEVGDYEAAAAGLSEAVELTRRIHGDDHRDTGVVLGNLASVRIDQGRLEEGEALTRESLAILERSPEADAQDLLIVEHRLVVVLHYTGRTDEAIPIVERLLERAAEVLPAGHPDALTYANTQAVLLDSTGDFAAAERVYRESIETSERVNGPDHPSTLLARANLVPLLLDRGRDEDGLALAREVMEARATALGPEHPNTLISRNILVFAMLHNEMWADAAELSRETLEMQRRILGAGHPDTLTSVGNYAVALKRLGDLETAEALFERNLRDLQALHRHGHDEIVTAHRNLGDLLIDQGRLEEAEAHYRSALDASRRVHEGDHDQTAGCYRDVATVLAKSGRGDAAEAMFREATSMVRRRHGEAAPQVTKALNNHAWSMWKDLGRIDVAAELYGEALTLARRSIPETERDVRFYILNFGDLLLESDDLPAFRALWEDHLRRLGEIEPVPVSATQWALARMASGLADAGDHAGAIARHAERATFVAEHDPDEPRRIASARSEYGGALAAAGHYAEAEPILIDAYHDLVEAGSKSRTRRALARIVDLYDRWGKDREKVRWEALLPDDAD